MHEPNPIPPPVVLTPCIGTQGTKSSPFPRRSSPSRDVLSSSSLPLRRPCRRHPGPVARRRLSQPTPRVLRAVQTRSHLCASPLRSCASLFSVSPPSLMMRHGWLLWMCRRDGKCPERNGWPRAWPRLFRAHAQCPSATCERVAPPAWPSPRPSTGGAGWVT